MNPLLLTKKDKCDSIDSVEAESVDGVEEKMLIDLALEQSRGAHHSSRGRVQVQALHDLRHQRRDLLTIVARSHELRNLRSNMKG